MKQSIVLTTLFTFLAISLAHAGIHGTGMGGIKTVTSEGPGDISRNPALLGTMKADKSLALFAIARAYTFYDTEIDADFSGASIDSVDPRDPLYLGGSLVAAYAFKAGNTTYGIALDGYDGNLVSRETSENRYNSSTLGNFDSEKETLSINPAVNLAMGWHTGNNSFLGFQVLLGNKYETEEETFSDSNTEKINQKHTVELGFGYTRQSNDTEIGIIIRSGTFSLEKKYMDKEFSSGNSDSNSTEYWPKYDKGLQLQTGAYTRLSEKMGLGIEFGYRLPVTYVEKSLNEDDTAETVNEDTIPVSLKGAVSLIGGLEFFMDESSSINTGLGYQAYDANGRDEGTVSDLSLSVINWTIGYNRRLSPGSELSIIFISYRQKSESFFRYEEGSFSYQLEGEDIRYAFEIGGGITYTF